MPANKDLKIAKEIATELRRELGDSIVSIILYGSRARGTAREDSDLDIFLLMKERPRIGSRESKIIGNIAWDILDKYDYKIYPSVMPYGLKDYKKWENFLSIFRNIKREGIQL